MIIIVRHTQNDKEKSKGNIIEDRQSKKVEYSQERKQETDKGRHIRRKKKQRINKETQRRKNEDRKEERKKERRRQTKKETEGERESRRYAKNDRRKVDDIKRKSQKRIGYEKIKIKKNICLIQRIDNNKKRQEENNRIEVCSIYLCWGNILKRSR